MLFCRGWPGKASQKKEHLRLRPEMMRERERVTCASVLRKHIPSSSLSVNCLIVHLSESFV